MSQITNLLLDRIVENLVANLNTGLVKTDLEYADIIKKGLLQQDKVQFNVQIGVQGGDHENPNYQDAIVTDRDLQDIGINWQSVAREIGGGQLWWRRGVVRIETFFVKEGLKENPAHIAAYNILGRVMNLIEQTDLNGIVDSYGERAENIYVFKNTFFQSGGQPNTFIFRGRVFWACSTWRE